MKRCPECGREYDNTMMFCLDDGAELLYGPARSEPSASAGGQFDEPATAMFGVPPLGGSSSESPTRGQIHTTDQTAIFQRGAEAEPRESLGGLSEKQSFSANRAAKPLIGAVVSVVLLVGGFFGYRYFSASGSKQINSIAVMPFENKNSDADTDYLSDGLAESVIFRLTQIPDLKVSPTSSVMRYKGKETDIAKIANELGVDAVMTGRLTKRGDNLNITVELVDARTNKSLWGEQYERKLAELLTTQREIVAEIVGKLQLKLSGESEQKLAKKYTDNNEAYQLYLQGRFHWNKRTEENIKKAIEQFKAAADLDPNFALAYAGLADCYNILPFWSNVPSSEILPQAKAYATRAVALDDSLGEAHISLAYANALIWDWAAAEKEFRRGLELSPNYATGHKWYGQYLSDHGRVEESLTEYGRAQELEPLSLMINANVAEAHLAKDDAAAAAEVCKRVIELDPNWYYAHQMLALSYVKQGRNAEALAEAQKAVELSKGNIFPLGTLGYVLAQIGKRSEALQIAEELKAEHTKRRGNGFAIAWTYIGLDDKNEAFRWLEKDLEKREASLPEFLALYPFNTLRDEARFKDLRKRMGLPE